MLCQPLPCWKGEIERMPWKACCPEKSLLNTYSTFFKLNKQQPIWKGTNTNSPFWPILHLAKSRRLVQIGVLPILCTWKQPWDGCTWDYIHVYLGTPTTPFITFWSMASNVVVIWFSLNMSIGYNWDLH